MKNYYLIIILIVSTLLIIIGAVLLTSSSLSEMVEENTQNIVTDFLSKDRIKDMKHYKIGFPPTIEPTEIQRVLSSYLLSSDDQRLNKYRIGLTKDYEFLNKNTLDYEQKLTEGIGQPLNRWLKEYGEKAGFDVIFKFEDNSPNVFATFAGNYICSFDMSLISTKTDDDVYFFNTYKSGYYTKLYYRRNMIILALLFVLSIVSIVNSVVRIKSSNAELLLNDYNLSKAKRNLEDYIKKHELFDENII